MVRIAVKNRDDREAIDRRSIAGRRIDVLKQVYADALAKAGVELSALRLGQIETAAAAVTTAEFARSRFLNAGGEGDLPALISAERRADQALRRLGLLSIDKPLAAARGAESLHQYMARKAASGETKGGAP